MINLFQAIPLVFVLACIALADMFRSALRVGSGVSISSMLYQPIAIVGGFVIYAEINYLMLDNLELVPGAVYVVA